MSLRLMRLAKSIRRSLCAAGKDPLANLRRSSSSLSAAIARSSTSWTSSTPCSSRMADQETDHLFHRLQIFQWLQKSSPCFSVDGSKVRVINQPDVFYATLLEKARTAKSRITLASLYLGTGKLEKELIESVEKALRSDKKPTVRVLLDATRGSRGVKNSRTMLLPLVQSYGDKCSVHLYHTPSLNGILKSVLPQRWDEIVGLQHMKLYLFDDSVLISGANLSNDYFTNRQDRYLLIEDSKNLADFCDQLVQTVSRFSFKLDKSNNLELDSQWGHHPFLNSSTDFVAEARKTVLSLYEKQRSSQNNDESFRWPNDKSHDTWIFPLVQMGQLNVDMDNICTRKILECIPTDAEMSLATGYFNLTQDYMTSILQTCRADVQILMAHPSANGFLGASGFAGGIPSAYTLLASQFYRQVIDTSQDLRIRLWEYRRLGWTFHAKGLWMSFTGNDTRPCFTLIGSPNFGYRSVYRDLEAQLAVVTVNARLRDQLDEERRRLFQTADPVKRNTFSSSERSVPIWVRLVISFFRHFF